MTETASSTMTTTTPPEGHLGAGHKPATDAEAVREIEAAAEAVRRRAAEIRQAPQLHKPKLILSSHVHGASLLDKIADVVTLLNLPQLSIMISPQVSANRAQTASDARAIADHETLIALHEMGKQQIEILDGQNQVLAMLKEFASKDLPGRQERIADTASKILAIVSESGPAHGASPA